MGRPLPRLRRDLDFLPSPVADQPGLLIRDPLRVSDTTAIVPPALARCLGLFDGQHDALDLRAALVEVTGQPDVGPIVEGFVAALTEAAFLEDEAYAARRTARERAFAAAPTRLAAHAGGAYAEDPRELGAQIDGWLDEGRSLTAAAAARERRLPGRGRAARQPRRRRPLLRRRPTPPSPRRGVTPPS